ESLSTRARDFAQCDVGPEGSSSPIATLLKAKPTTPSHIAVPIGQPCNGCCFWARAKKWPHGCIPPGSSTSPHNEDDAIYFAYSIVVTAIALIGPTQADRLPPTGYT